MSIFNKYANEIAENMAKTLNDVEFTKLFKTASFEKTAGQALEAFKKDVDVASNDGQDLELVYTKHLGTLSKEENTEPGTISKAREYMAGKQLGMALPPAGNLCMDCGDMSPQEVVAAQFVLANLTKIADALDNKGFSKLANIIDETMKSVKRGGK